MLSRASLPFAAVVTALLVACTPGDARPATSTPRQSPVIDVQVEPAALTMRAGTDARLAAQANDLRGQPVGGAELRYSVTDPRILRVTERGLVTALGPASRGTEIVVASGSAERRIPVVVLAGSAARLDALSGVGQRVPAGSAIAPLAVRAVDGWGNSVAGATIAVRAEPAAAFGDATTPLPTRFTTDESGRVIVSPPDAVRAGRIGLQFQIMGSEGAATPIGASRFDVEVEPGPAAALTVVAAPTIEGPGQNAWIVRLKLTDAFGNAIARRELCTTAAADGVGARATTDESGIATMRWPAVSRERTVRTTTCEGADAPAAKLVLPAVPGLRRQAER